MFLLCCSSTFPWDGWGEENVKPYEQTPARFTGLSVYSKCANYKIILIFISYYSYDILVG